MATKTVRIGVEIDRDTDRKFETWAETEGMSKRRHGADLLRRLTTLRETHPAELARLGLADPRCINELAGAQA